MFWFVCRRIALFPTILHGKKVSGYFAVSHVDFYLILIKATSSAKLRCFQHYLCESNHFLCFVTKLHF